MLMNLLVADFPNVHLKSHRSVVQHPLCMLEVAGSISNYIKDLIIIQWSYVTSPQL